MFSVLEDTFQLIDLFPKWSISKGINWGGGDLARYKRNSVCNKTFIQNSSWSKLTLYPFYFLHLLITYLYHIGNCRILEIFMYKNTHMMVLLHVLALF